jgi:hypothetical protein
MLFSVIQKSLSFTDKYDTLYVLLLLPQYYLRIHHVSSYLLSIFLFVCLLLTKGVYCLPLSGVTWKVYFLVWVLVLLITLKTCNVRVMRRWVNILIFLWKNSGTVLHSDHPFPSSVLMLIKFF